MARYGATSKRAPSDVVERALRFFGPKGLGLDVLSSGADGAQFDGGGGKVYLAVTPRERGCELEIETQEWDTQVVKFLRKL